MKIKLLLASGLMLLGLSVNANIITDVTDKVMNALDKEGHFDGFSGNEIDFVEDHVKNAISNEFTAFNNDELKLIESNTQPAFLGDFWEKAKDVGRKAIEKISGKSGSAKDTAKKAFALAGKALVFAEDIAPKIEEFLKNNRGTLVKIAGMLDPKYETLVEELIDKYPTVYKPALAGLTAVVTLGQKLTDTQVMEEIAEVVERSEPKKLETDSDE